MSKRLYVGNLAYSCTEDQLRAAFSACGEVVSATVMVDRMTGQSRGFGFVEMASAEQATRAIEALDGSMLDGRALRVNEARERSFGGGGGGGGGGYGGGGGGGFGGRGGGGGGGPGGGRRGARGGGDGRGPRRDRDR